MQFDTSESRFIYVSERLVDVHLGPLEAMRGTWQASEIKVSTPIGSATTRPDRSLALFKRVRVVTEGLADRTEALGASSQPEFIRAVFGMRWGFLQTFQGSYRVAWFDGRAKAATTGAVVAATLCGSLHNYIDYSGPVERDHAFGGWWPSSAAGFEQLIIPNADGTESLEGAHRAVGTYRDIKAADLIHWSDILDKRHWHRNGVMEALIEVIYYEPAPAHWDLDFEYSLIGAPIWVRYAPEREQWRATGHGWQRRRQAAMLAQRLGVPASLANRPSFVLPPVADDREES
jgi:hypothetical protein